LKIVANTLNFLKSIDALLES